jgi:hypothetical protein
MFGTILYSIIIGGMTSFHVPNLFERDQNAIKAARKLWAIKFALFTFIAALTHYILQGVESQSDVFGISFLLVHALLLLNVFMKGGDLPVLVSCILLVNFWVASCTANFDEAPRLAARIGPVERVQWGKTPPPLTLAHTPLVSHEQAVAKGTKAASETFGSRYNIGVFTLQRIKGTATWVAPLDYRGFGGWLFGDSAQAVITVDATDSNAPAQVVSTDLKNAPVKLVFTPGAYFGSDIIRHINQHEGLSFFFKEGHLELDDDLKAWWVVTGYTFADYGDYARGGKILLVDPENGNIRSFTPDTTPSWVDVTVSRGAVANQVKDWGTLSGGYAASFIGSPHLTAPAAVKSESTWLVQGSDGRSYFYTGLRQANVRFHRLVGFTLTDARSGRTVEYAHDEGVGLTPTIAFEAVSKRLPSSEGLSPTTPLLLSLEGRPAYLVSIIDASGTLKKVALVDALGDLIVIREDKESAHKEFQKLLKGPAGATS